MLKSGVVYDWTFARQQAFDQLKKVVAYALVLKVVDPQLPYVLETDASDVAIEVVLIQQDGPIVFLSKKFSPPQKKWPTHELELYVVINALKTWRHYLYGVDFNVLTDHATLKYFCTQPELRGRQGR
jgi:hypothetical protein